MSTQNCRVVVKSDLKLTPAQEERMLLHLQARHNAVRNAQGWQELGNFTGWLAKRKQAQAEYNNDFAHRANEKRYGTLYKIYNNSVNVPKRAIRVFKARCCDNLINSDPFAALFPEGIEDAAEEIRYAERYWHKQLKAAEAQYHFRAGIEQAAISGETIMKSTLRFPSKFKPQKNQSVWMTPDGQALQDSRGRWIYESDAWEPNETDMESEQLRRDPSIKKPPGAMLTTDKHPFKPILKKTELEVRKIGYADFVCSPLEEDIHTADYVAHVFDMSLDILWQETGGVTLTPRAKEWRANLKSKGSVNAKSDAGQPVARSGEVEPDRDASLKLGLAESWFRFDPYDNGELYELYCLWDTSDATPISYEMMETVSPSGKRPFEVIRVIPVPDRWYGMGFYELLSNEHEFVDRQWTRIDARNGSSGRITWKKKGAFTADAQGKPLDLSSNRIFEIADEDPTKAFGYFVLPPMDESIWKMLEFCLQSAQLMSGTMTPGDANNANLESAKLATGINALEAESELMSSDTTLDVKRGVTAALEQSVIVVFANFDVEAARMQLKQSQADKLAEWLKSNPPDTLLDAVRLTMTKARSKTQMEANQQAIQVITGGMPWTEVVAQFPQFAEQLKPLYQGILDNLDIQHADKILSIPQIQPPPINDPAAIPGALPPDGTVPAGPVV